MGGQHDQIDPLIFSGVENRFEGIATRDKISDLGQLFHPRMTRWFQ
jgi:hypothetical protein